MIKHGFVTSAYIRRRFTQVPNAILESEPGLTWAAKAVWVYLASRPPGWDVCIADIVKRSKDGEHAVRARIQELQDLGWLKCIQTRVQGKWGPIEYRLLIPDRFGLTASAEEALLATPPYGDSPHPEIPDTDSPHPEKPHAVNPAQTIRSGSKTNPSNTNEDQPPTPTQASNGSMTAFQAFCDDLVREWNRMAGDCGLAQVRTLGNERMRAARKAWLDEAFRESWQEALAAIPRSKWHMGDNERQWRATIAWFLRPGKALNLLDQVTAQRNSGPRDKSARRAADRQGTFEL